MNTRLEIHGVLGKLTLAEKAIPKPPADGFILKTHYAGICHSDVHVWKNTVKITDDLTLGMEAFIPDFSYPYVLGHEMSGEIYAIAENYTGKRKVGERVAVYPWLGCNNCAMCTSKNTYMCPMNVACSLGLGKDGAYQQYVSVPDMKYAVHVPDGVGMEVACLFGCSALTAYNAVCKVRNSIENACRRTGSGKLLVIGAGGVGLWVIQWAKALLPDKTIIYVADVTEDKLLLAKENGAHDTILWERGVADDALIAKTKEVTSGGIDGCIDLVGIGPTVNKAFQCAQKQATIAVVGLSGGLASIPIFALALNAVTLTGVYTGSEDQMEDMITAYIKHHVVAPPISIVQPTEAESALTNLMEGKVQGRSVINFVSNGTRN